MTGPGGKKKTIAQRLQAPRRGRPVLFDADARKRYLDLVASGLTYTEAATASGTPLRTVQYTAQHDAGFDQDRTQARATGKQARIDRTPHGLSRYNHHGCRCPICRKAATAARAASPDRRPHQPEADLMHLTPNPPPTTPETETFVLARAS